MVLVRIMLDTNLWSSIGDEGVATSFDALMTARGFDVLVAPSVLLEVIRIPVPQARQRIIRAMGIGPRRRLATEAQSESTEVIASSISRRRWAASTRLAVC